METKTQPWEPNGFEQYQELFPETPNLGLTPELYWGERFANIWYRGVEHAEGLLASSANKTTVIFVRGYLGNYMLGNLRQPARALKNIGFDTLIIKNLAGGSVEKNVKLMRSQIQERANREQLLFCGHSRGGLECLHLLAQDKSIADKCIGVALSQTSHGPSLVMESVLQNHHQQQRYSLRRKVAEILQRRTLSMIRAQRAGHELTSMVWPKLVKKVESIKWPFTVLQTASWSTQPTFWLDSFHERLGEICPGRAHDGQFYLDHLIWPNLPHVLLPNVDHAQPAVGGAGFDASRYWITLLAVMIVASKYQLDEIERLDNK